MSLLNFAQNELQINCWTKMEEIFNAIEAGERKILVRSCNGAGKTTALAAICNWYFSTYEDSIVLTTASSWTQVRRNLWGEIRRQARKAQLYSKEVRRTETSYHISDKHFMLGISPSIPENAMGFHAPHMLIAVDEATGVNNEIMDALMGNMSGTDSQIVMICNPIDKQSYPYRAEASGDWKVIQISAFDHPNVDQGREIIRGAVTREWIEDRVRSWSFEVEMQSDDALIAQQERAFCVDWLGKYFRKTPLAQARILGEWAQLDSVGFIPMELIERNLRPENYVSENVKVRAMGVDISRGIGGDETVFTMFDVREDVPDVQTGFTTLTEYNLMMTAQRIKEEYDLAKSQGIELIIAIDDTGIGGGVSDRLQVLCVPFFPVNFGEAAEGFLPGKPLANRRAEMYFLLQRELLDGKILLRNFKRFHEELAAVRLDTHANTGAYKMEAKTDVRLRLGRSPDYADATALARYALRLYAHQKRDMLF